MSLKPKRVPLHDVALALIAAEFRADLDALLARHGAQIVFAWESKHALLKVQFKACTDRQLVLVECSKGKGARYVMQEEATP